MLFHHMSAIKQQHGHLFLEAHLHSVSEAHLQSAPQEQPDA